MKSLFRIKGYREEFDSAVSSKHQSPTGGVIDAVTIVDALLHDAISKPVSDIHIEPIDDGLRIRYRIDGVLSDQLPLENQFKAEVISRVKVLAQIDIAEKRIPQDGKFSFSSNLKTVDLRVSTFPAVGGEKVVIRILDRAAQALGLERLGLADDMYQQLKTLLHRPHVFFLVTGPTGSGKTTTLYAALSMLHSPEKNSVTLEDPVEYSLPGVTQGQINPQAGFTFARGIRAVLRQDPDILMVGEIRDRETAATAIEASLTGHVVLSTLHTNDASSAVIRLMDMGIEPFLINASLGGVLAQRLARKICTMCKVQMPETPEYLIRAQLFGLANIPTYYGIGCASCDHLGYKGRIGIFELLTLTNDLRSCIVKAPSVDAIRDRAIAGGMRTLTTDAVAKVVKGIISLDECARVAS